MGNWYKRRSRKTGGTTRRTFTHSSKGFTTSSSFGTSKRRATFTQLPDGTRRIMDTMRCGTFTKRTVKTIKPKTWSSSSPKSRKVQQFQGDDAVSFWSVILVLLFIGWLIVR